MSPCWRGTTTGSGRDCTTSMATMNRVSIGVCIVDGLSIRRVGIERALEAADGIHIVGSYATWNDVPVSLTKAGSCGDVTILDVFLFGDVPCLDLIASLAPATKILLVSAFDRSADIEACRKSGACGYVNKSATAQAFAGVVEAVAAGRKVFAASGVATPVPLSGSNGISPRERQVLAYVTGGYTHDQIARRLSISPHTVDTYVKRLRGKLDARSTADLVRAALTGAVAL